MSHLWVETLKRYNVGVNMNRDQPLQELHKIHSEFISISETAFK